MWLWSGLSEAETADSKFFNLPSQAPHMGNPKCICRSFPFPHHSFSICSCTQRWFRPILYGAPILSSDFREALDQRFGLRKAYFMAKLMVRKPSKQFMAFCQQGKCDGHPLSPASRQSVKITPCLRFGGSTVVIGGMQSQFWRMLMVFNPQFGPTPSFGGEKVVYSLVNVRKIVMCI